MEGKGQLLFWWYREDDEVTLDVWMIDWISNYVKNEPICSWDDCISLSRYPLELSPTLLVFPRSYTLGFKDFPPYT